MGKVNKLPLEKLGHDWVNEGNFNNKYHLESNKKKLNKSHALHMMNTCHLSTGSPRLQTYYLFLF